MPSTVLLIACVACIIVAQLFILRSALGTAVVAHDAELPHPRRGAEVAWAVLPAIALGVVLWMTWRESRTALPSPPPAPAHGGHGAHES